MKLPEHIARHTMHVFNDCIKPEILFIVSMCLFPVFLFLPGVYPVWSAAALFFLLTLCRRGKMKLLPSVIITAGIVFFALLSPYGKVLLQIGSFRITDGALTAGLHKSGILVGMVFLSQFAVSSQLHFPGRPGRFLSCMFGVFDQLTAKRISFKPGTVISSIDDRLVEIWSSRS
jgi:hypothetical protein